MAGGNGEGSQRIWSSFCTTNSTDTILAVRGSRIYNYVQISANFTSIDFNGDSRGARAKCKFMRWLFGSWSSINDILLTTISSAECGFRIITSDIQNIHFITVSDSSSLIVGNFSKLFLKYLKSQVV